jgi:tRNA A-37 threonylcarbamoyl transferase component Bud32
MEIQFNVPEKFFLKGIPCRVELFPGQVLGDFVVEKLLGSGAFGDVYQVSRQGEYYAMKILKLWEVVYREQKELVGERFLHEYHAARTHSEYLVHTHAFGEIEHNPFFMMDFFPAGDLRGQLGELSREQITGAGLDTLRGLRDLHAEGIIHRDIKPDNVLLATDGKALLTDFGVSAFVNHHIKRRTRPNLFGNVKETFGTYAYIAPEQLVDSKKYAATTPRTDIWSWGVMMYELFSGGDYPWGALETESDLVEFIRNANSGRFAYEAAFDAMPGDWGPVIRCALQPRMADRCEHVPGMLQVLENQSEKTTARAIPADRAFILRVLQGVERDRIYLIKPEDGVVSIGRGMANDIQLEDYSTTYMSRYHATVERSPDKGGWFLRDGQWSDEDGAWLPSTNGTWLNSTALDTEEGMKLTEGDLVIMGDTTLRVEIIELKKR